MEGVLWKGIIRYALPLMISFIIQQLYNTVDTAIVGRYAGSSALAAVGSTNSLVNLLVGVFLGIANGTGVVFGQYYGAKDTKNMKSVLDTSMVISLLAGALLTVIGVVLAPLMLGAINCPAEIRGSSAVYLRIYFAGMIPMLVYNVGAGIIYAVGDSKNPLIYLALSGLINFILDFVFVAVFHWGVAGAAFATTLSQLISAVLICGHLIKKFPKEYCLVVRSIRYSALMSRQILRISIPCAIQSAMFDIANLIVSSHINFHGTTIIAANAAQNKIDAFTWITIKAFSMTSTTLTSQCVGAKIGSRAKKGIALCLVFSLIGSGLMAGSFLLFGRAFLGIFTDDAAVIDHGVLMFSIIAPFSWLYSVSEVISGAIRGAGKPVPVTVITAVTVCVYRVLWLSIFCTFVTRDIRAVYWCYPISWMMCNVCTLLYYRFGHWMPKGLELFGKKSEE